MKQYLVSEEKVKKALKIDSFRNLSKDKIVEFVSLIPQMDKEVAISIINQFPNYTEYATNIVEQLRIECDHVLQSNDQSQLEAINGYKTLLDDFGEELKKDGKTFEERKYWAEKMVEVANCISTKDTEHKKFLLDVVRGVSFAVGGLAILGAAILGVSIKSRGIPELKDDYIDEIDCDEDDDDE